MSVSQPPRCALVTGGCSGIGRAIGLALADSGCRVLATSLSAEEGQEFDAEGHTIETAVLDVTEEASISNLMKRLNQLDILVNCAGAIARGGAEHTPEVFARILDVNLNGTMRVSTACHRLLAESGGCVLNVASMLSFFGSGRVPAYSASKGGIVQLTKSLAIAWAPDGIRVNAIAPGWIRTNLTQPLLENEPFYDGIVARTPLGRWGDPHEIAPAAVFLCSPDAAFITGAVLPVDGGYSVK